jgi:anti-sigma factor RsiW
LSDQDRKPDPHPVALLLPGYQAGVLSRAQVVAVEEHLAGCPECRAELQSDRELASRYAAADAALGDPPARLFSDVMANVKAEVRPARAAAPGQRPGRSPAPLARLLDACRSLLSPAWAPPVAIALLLAQFGLLVGMRAPHHDVGETAVTTRGLAPQAAQLEIVFQPGVTVGTVYETLAAAHARLVAGPTAEGAVTVELPPGDGEAFKRLMALRDQPTLIKRIGPPATTPGMN